MFKNYANWIEIDLNAERIDNTYDDFVKSYEIILDEKEYNIIFFGAKLKLKPQEYKFLKSILAQNTKIISAEKIMKQIGSKCKEEDYKKFSYRIRSKIKSKLKEAMLNMYPKVETKKNSILDDYLKTEAKNNSTKTERKSKVDVCFKIGGTPEQYNWVVIDNEWQSNYEKDELVNRVHYYQVFDFESEFKNLVSVKDGRYHTYFKKCERKVPRHKKH